MSVWLSKADSGEETQAAAAAPGPLSFARLGRARHVLSVVAVAVLLTIVWTALARLSSEVTYDDVVRELLATPWPHIGASIALTAGSFLVLSFYDMAALTFIDKRRPWPPVALTSFFAFAVGNIAGFGPLTGGAIRYRFYSALGLDAADTAKIVAFVSGTFGLGIATVTGLGLTLVAEDVAVPLGLSAGLLRAAGLATLGAVAILILAAARHRTVRIGRWELAPPSPLMLAIQIAISVLDIALAATALYVLLPASGISPGAFVAIYAVAVGLGILSHVPGGIGVFEAVIVGVLSRSAGVDQILGALVLFRAIYYVLPLLVAALVASILETRRLASGALEPLVAAAVRIAPPVLSAMTFVMGAILIFSGVTPATPASLDLLARYIPLPLLESAHFFTSLLGIGLLIVARGLAFRLDGAWWGAMVAVIVAIALSLTKAIAIVEAALLLVLGVALFVARDSFTRRSRLTAQALSPPWFAAIMTVLISAFAILMFAYSEVQYAHELWWQFELSSEAPRSMRALLGVIIALGCFGASSLLHHARAVPPPASKADIERAVAIVEGGSQADGNLVRTGDKSVLFSTDGRAFIMYGVRARSWIALFDPIGPKDAWPDLVWQFMETAREAGGRAVFYQVTADNLALYADAGLQAFKLGEEALVDLEDFDLAGSKRAGLRQSYHRAQREGLGFELIPREGVPAVYDELSGISDAWLAHHKTREKSFSIGAFTRDYVLSQPVAVLRRQGRIIAFVTLMTTGTRDEATVDLMRFAANAPNVAMDFLFTSLCLVLRNQGFRRFTLGMAPLSGLSPSPAAPLWHRIGNAVFQHGERLYNFRGLRAFKDKFHPDWRPRYLAVPGGIEPALALADAAALIGGGWKGIIGK